MKTESTIETTPSRRPIVLEIVAVDETPDIDAAADHYVQMVLRQHGFALTVPARTAA